MKTRPCLTERLLIGRKESAQTKKQTHMTAHRHITLPSGKSRPETWLWKYMGKATTVWQFTLSLHCYQI